ncbi:glycosyltransferase [Sporolactobacillus sp. THM19-2]|uniref:glycosyltransferase n=1 Tax=Sporolactobacillus sp. THM19-2 TaxID=2511171 RepID=UPI00101F4BD1|nr:glycosyltransferase [Sporolactobacillus sp. THM19-2]RYL90303.1 glycosyltransferase [Sporolactobacillus sp. THM19-2]
MSLPKISVIVPIYNVQRYLKACLNALAKQSYNNIEVIMVNDGSTDNSGKIMHHYAKRYTHFFAHDKRNGGLGQARNYGLQFVSGKYIAFVDSDDLVTPHAYEKMVSTIEKTQSDMVIGHVTRFNSYKKFPSDLHRLVFKKKSLKDHITRNHDLVYDTTAWNKLYRRSFWEANHFSFPEGMLYEDIPVTFPAHYLAHSVDVLDDVVYLWRYRNFSSPSITQDRTDIKNLEDRLKAIDSVNHFFETHDIDDDLRSAMDFKLLKIDLLLYLNRLDLCGEDFVNLFFEKVNQYLNVIPERVLLQLPPVDRIKYYYVKKRDKQRLFEILSYSKSRAFRRQKPIRRKEHYYFSSPSSDQLPDHYLIMDQQMTAVRTLKRIRWKKHTLSISGGAYIKSVDLADRSDVAMIFSLVNDATEEKYPIDKTRLTKTWRNTLSAAIGGRLSHPHIDFVYNYNWSGYILNISFDQLPFSTLPEGTYYLRGTIDAGDLSRSFRAGRLKWRNQTLMARDVGQRMIQIHFSGNGDMYFRVYHGQRVQPDA